MASSNPSHTPFTAQSPPSKRQRQINTKVASPTEPIPKKQSTTRSSIPRDATNPDPMRNALGTQERAVNIISWNIAGLRGFLKKPESTDELRRLIVNENVDIIAFQETKLQESHINECTLKLNEILVPFKFDSKWAVSTTKKGYSGVATLIRKDKSNGYVPLESGGEKWRVGGIDGESDGEGRSVVLNLDQFVFVNVYVPNSGEGLKRLEYRVNKYDEKLRVYMEKLKKNGKNVILGGDLNVAHLDSDFFNPGEKRMEKQAGTTPQERASFGKLLQQCGETEGKAWWVDAFRHLYPDASGVYTYWSMRAGNRAYNRGLRLDYFVVSSELLHDTERGARVLDCTVLDSYLGSDHAPVKLSLAIAPTPRAEEQ
eukprot:CAMPEP_0182446466 /NCGR_PEP_ID=MMETSP1172-20130603/4221_1 /TAXON_ID=708627 /ORGANISM="Timspurckia oligopyrenoides, Strain CCMP3278" /LENGTH=370 /DNA_ID=CAMNT_0024642399 /DNA_START=1241 /DNA_END=2353 /DNA_ORIENTATION=-